MAMTKVKFLSNIEAPNITSATYVAAPNIYTKASTYSKNQVNAKLGLYVRKAHKKGLSTYDFNDYYKNKIDTLQKLVSLVTASE